LKIKKKILVFKKNKIKIIKIQMWNRKSKVYKNKKKIVFKIKMKKVFKIKMEKVFKMMNNSKIKMKTKNKIKRMSYKGRNKINKKRNQKN